jgi:DNA-directed RNA polymerase specialized sigma24 family protein
MKIELEKNPETLESIHAFYESRYDSLFLPVARFISKRGGTVEDASDIYHDALVLYYEKCQQPGFVVQADEAAYIMGIVKNRWAQKSKYDALRQPLELHMDSLETHADTIDHQRLYSVVVKAGKKCLDLLSVFYGKQASLKTIAASFGFQSEHAVAVQKYKCLEKIRETVKQNSLHHEDFFE